MIVAVTASCSSQRDEARAGTSLLMVGDSISFMSLEPLHAVLAAEGYTQVTIDAVPGRPIADGVGVVELAVASGARPDVWVIALGTNDLYHGTDVPAYRALVERLLAQIPEGEPVVWVDTYIRDRVEEARAFNAALADALAERGDAETAHWFERCVEAGEVLLVGDGVHPSESGTLAFADTVRRALRSS